MKQTVKKTFHSGFASWNKNTLASTTTDWAQQLRILNEVAELITHELSLEEIISTIYQNVNHLIDAFQFAAGIYNEQEGTITYTGMIENGVQIPQFSVDAAASNRFASWCILHNSDIFMNDIDTEYSRYLPAKPVPLAGSNPGAAIYVPLRLHEKVVGLITVRTIRKNVYHPHHLYILKTVGNFVVRALELSKYHSQAIAKIKNHQKEWRWQAITELSLYSKKILLLLTEREKEVLLLLATGMSNKKIAGQLFISPQTVKSHTLHLYEKTGSANRTAAIMKAIELGWFI